MEQNSARYRQILERLNAVRRKRRLYALAAGVFSWFLTSVLLVTAIVVAEQLFSFGTAGRSVLFALGIAGTAAAFLVFAGRPILLLAGILRAESDDAMAQLVGGHFPAVRDRLLDAMQLYEARDSSGQHYAVSLIDASLEDLYRAIEPLDFTVAVDDAGVRKVRRYAAIAAGLAMFLFVLSPGGFFGSVNRLVHYGQTFAAPQQVRFVVAPGNAEVVRGQNVTVEVLTEGSPVEELTLHARHEGEMEFASSPLKPLGGRRFAAEMTALKLNTEYYVSAEKSESDRFKISVLDRPLIRSLAVRVIPPAYTRLPESALQENTGDVTAYPGSSVRVTVVPSKPVRTASLVFGDSTRVACRLEDGKMMAAFTVRRTGTYRILMADNDGLTNADPIEYAVKALADASPTVELVSPGKNIDLAGAMTLPLLARAKDDFGFTRARLGYRLAQSRYEQPADADAFIDLPLGAGAQTSLEIPYLWDLAPLHLVPEDAVAYFIEVFDNDNVSGPKSARTETFLIRLPSLEEVFTDVSQTHDQSMESMQSAAKETQQMKKDIEDLQREMKKPREKMDWQQQKKAEQMAERYDAMKKKIDESAAKMDEMMKKMEENSVLSDKTLEKYKELQKLMEELNSPELQEALKKLQESMKHHHFRKNVVVFVAFCLILI